MACGIALARLRQPAIVGYIFAGVLLGPSVLGLVEDRTSISLLAELGIIMLLFVIGMELSVRRFAEVWKIALATTLLQIGGSVGLMLLVRGLLDWSLGTAVLLGFAVALSSTAVVIKLLEQLGELHGPSGRLVVGILIAQDMAVVPMMLGLSTLTGDGLAPMEGAKVVISIVVLVALVMILLKREITVPYAALVAGHGDLAPLAAFAVCFGAAAVAGLSGLSPGYGAFIAGLILGNSTEGHKLVRHAQSIQSILLMVFFLSVGLLLDLDFLWDNIGAVLVMLAVVTIFKTLLNVGALRLQRVAWADAVLAGFALAQIGEFSFLLAGTGLSLGLLQENQGQLVIAVTVLSLVFSPLWLAGARRIGASTSRSSLADVLDAVAGPEAGRLGGLYQRGRAAMRRRWLTFRVHRARRLEARRDGPPRRRTDDHTEG